MKKLLLILVILLIPNLAFAPKKRRWKDPAHKFAQSLVSREMKQCVRDPACPLREKVLVHMTYVDTVIHDLQVSSDLLTELVQRQISE